MECDSSRNELANFQAILNLKHPDHDGLRSPSGDLRGCAPLLVRSGLAFEVGVQKSHICVRGGNAVLLFPKTVPFIREYQVFDRDFICLDCRNQR